MAISFIIYLQARPWRKSRTLTRTRRVTRREMTKMVSTSFFRLLLEYAYSSIQHSGGSEKFGFRPGSFSFILVLNTNLNSNFLFTNIDSYFYWNVQFFYKMWFVFAGNEQLDIGEKVCLQTESVFWIHIYRIRIQPKISIRIQKKGLESGSGS